MTTKLTDFQPLQDEVVRLRAENERLQSRLAEVTAQLVDARTELRNNTPPRPGAKAVTIQEPAYVSELRANIVRLEADNERLRAALRDMIEISTRNSEATLMLIGIRKCAERALEPKP